MGLNNNDFLERILAFLTKKREKKELCAGLAVGLVIIAVVITAVVVALHRGVDSTEGPRAREACAIRWNSWYHWGVGKKTRTVYCKPTTASNDTQFPNTDLAKGSLNRCRELCLQQDGCKFVSFERRWECRFWANCSLHNDALENSTAVSGYDTVMNASCPTRCPIDGKRCLGGLVGFETASSFSNCLHECQSHSANFEVSAKCYWVAFNSKTGECRFLADCDHVQGADGWISGPKRCLDVEPY